MLIEKTMYKIAIWIETHWIFYFYDVLLIGSYTVFSV